MELALWALGTLMVVGLIIALIVIINKQSGSNSNTKPKNELDIAKERYLRGEITGEELEEIARHLKY
jgi:uncharacterized membrane protein